MKIKSVTVNTVVEINGKQIVVKTSDWTDSIKAAMKDGCELDDERDILDWLEIDWEGRILRNGSER